MKVIKVLNVISDSNIGGAGKCLINFFANYDRERFDCAVMVPRGSKLKAGLEAVGARVLEADGMENRSLSLEGVRAACAVLKDERPDVVHCHGAMSARIAASLCTGAAVVYTRHCVFEPSSLARSLPGRLAGRLVSTLFSRRIIAVAQAAKDNLTDTGVPPEKVDVVLNGIDPVPRRSAEEVLSLRRSFGVPDGSRVVSIVARLEEIKGHAYFIEAAKKVLNQGVDAVFLIAGTGGIEAQLREMVHAQGLEKRVLFTGFLSDVSGLFNITDISVNASYGTEATSLSLLEGMSLGKPAVVSDYGGNPGVITHGKNGLIVPVKDSGALAEGIASLLTDEALYARLSQGAEEIFQEKFTSQAMTRAIERVYYECCGVAR